MATIPISSSEKSHGQRSLVGFSLCGHRESGSQLAGSGPGSPSEHGPAFSSHQKAPQCLWVEGFETEVKPVPKQVWNLILYHLPMGISV